MSRIHAITIGFPNERFASYGGFAELLQAVLIELRIQDLSTDSDRVQR